MRPRWSQHECGLRQSQWKGGANRAGGVEVHGKDRAKTDQWGAGGTREPGGTGRMMVPGGAWSSEVRGRARGSLHHGGAEDRGSRHFNITGLSRRRRRSRGAIQDQHNPHRITGWHTWRRRDLMAGQDLQGRWRLGAVQNHQ